MTTKYQRPAGAYTGASGLANRSKYQDDANATPKRAISSAKVDGDVNYLVDALNSIDEASGTQASISARLAVALNDDGTLKTSVAGAMDEFVVHTTAGTLARVDNSTFTLAGGDFTATYTANRRVKLTVAGGTLVGDVVSSTYAAGLTTVTCVDLYDNSGALGVLSSAPMQVAYAPLTPGVRGNQMRKVESLSFPAVGATYDVTTSNTDLVIKRAGSIVARVGAGGVSGMAAASVGTAALGSDVASRLLPTGVVVPFAGSAAPTGWLFCAGQVVSRSTYADLFATLGTTYGAGDGTTTFALPDLRGRVPFGLDAMGGGSDGGRLSVANTLGLTGGAEKKSGTTDAYTLTIADIPSHSHGIQSGNNTTGTGNYVDNGSVSSTDPGASTLPVGGGGGHSHGIGNFDVMPPYMLLNYIIKA